MSLLVPPEQLVVTFVFSVTLIDGHSIPLVVSISLEQTAAEYENDHYLQQHNSDIIVTTKAKGGYVCPIFFYWKGTHNVTFGDCKSYIFLLQISA